MWEICELFLCGRRCLAAMMRQKRDEFVKGFEPLEGIRKDVSVCFLKHLLNVIQIASLVLLKRLKIAQQRFKNCLHLKIFGRVKPEIYSELCVCDFLPRGLQTRIFDRCQGVSSYTRINLEIENIVIVLMTKVAVKISSWNWRENMLRRRSFIIFMNE